MKTAVIYYSYDGNCALVAENIKNELKADTYEIKTVDTKRRRGLSLMAWGGGQVVFGKKPPILPLTVDTAAYDLVILGTPVWAGSPAPAILSFLDKTKISGKKIALYCCHGGGMGKVFQKLRTHLPGNAIISEAYFITPKKQDISAVKQKIAEWTKTLTV